MKSSDTSRSISRIRSERKMDAPLSTAIRCTRWPRKSRADRGPSRRPAALWRCGGAARTDAFVRDSIAYSLWLTPNNQGDSLRGKWVHSIQPRCASSPATARAEAAAEFVAVQSPGLYCKDAFNKLRQRCLAAQQGSGHRRRRLYRQRHRLGSQSPGLPEYSNRRFFFSIRKGSRNLHALHFTGRLSRTLCRALCASGAAGWESLILSFTLGGCSSTLEQNADYLRRNNFEFSRDLAAFALANNVRFLYASSAATYGDGSAGMDDGNPRLLANLRPLNLYATSKQTMDLHAWQARLAWTASSRSNTSTYLVPTKATREICEA